MAKFDWLKEKKKQAKNAKLQKVDQVSFATTPVGARFANDTGFGTDGVLQQNKPVMQVPTMQGPRMIHEGEQMRQGVNGSVQVVPQNQLIAEERLNNIPGFQNGGQFQPRPMSTPPKVVPMNKPDTPPMQNKPAGQTAVPMTKNDVIPPPTNKAINPPGGPQKPKEINITPPTPNVQDIAPNINITPPDPNVQDITPNVTTPPVITPDTITPNVKGVLDKDALSKEQMQELQKEANLKDQKPVDPEIPVEKEFDPFIKDALEQLKKQAEGGSPAQKAAYQKSLDDLKATQSTERMVAAQQAAQAGIGGVEARTFGLESARNAGMALAEATAQGGIAQMQSAQEATKAMAQIGLQGAQLEQAGQQWQQQFDFAKSKYGDQEGQRMFADINSGMTYDQMRSKYPSLSRDDYQSMKDATPLSQFNKSQDFDKKMTSLNALMQQGGEQNLKQASEMFKEMFGQDLDMDNALKADNAKNFQNGMSTLSAHLASGIDFETAMKAMKADGTFDQLGMMEKDVKKMYNSMKLQSNPIYQANKNIDDLVQSGIYTKEQGEQLKDLMVWTNTHPEGVDISDKYVVTDQNGKVVKAFDTEAEAFAFEDANADKKYNTEFQKNYITLKDDGTVDGDGQGIDKTGTVKQQFQQFQDLQIPDDANEFMETVTQSDWVEAGKPDTWEEFKVWLDKKTVTDKEAAKKKAKKKAEEAAKKKAEEDKKNKEKNKKPEDEDGLIKPDVDKGDIEFPADG